MLAGPYATRLLADFGAEVIKVQPLTPQEDSKFAQGYYNTWNRNKLGVTLNLDRKEGIALAKKLVGISDAVVENFAPRVMANWKLDYKHLEKIKPDIVMLSMSTMGNTGPWRDYIGFGATVQAFSGMTALTSYPGKPPSGLGFSYADHVAGLTASFALLAALRLRKRTGKGQFIDVSQVEAMTSLLGSTILEYAVKGKISEDNVSDDAAPSGVYRCQGEDRWCAISIFDNEEWVRFCHAVGNPSWAKNARYSTPGGRQQNREELDKLIGGWTKEHTPDEVMALLQKEDIAAGVVQDARDLANDPQLKARNFFVELEHPEPGKTISDASPIKLSENPAQYKRPPPLSGQDNDYVYGELLGLSKDEIARLKEQGVI